MTSWSLGQGRGERAPIRKMDRYYAPLPADRRWRRVTLVAALLVTLGVFRSLTPVLVCFVILERSLGWVVDQLKHRTGVSRGRALAVVLTLLAMTTGAFFFVFVRRALPVIQLVRRNGAQYFSELIRHPSVDRLREVAGLEHEPLSNVLREHAGTALRYATGTAHIVMYLLVGFLLAVIYLFERDELGEWTAKVARDSLAGTMLRWFGFVADAIAVTVKMQAVVAVVSALVTLPVLIILGLPGIPSLFVLLLVAGLVPIVGNAFSGAVLCYVAYAAKGWWAVGVFLGVTFILHKIESYYLNPRLAAQHVRLPGLVLIVSLLLFEQVFGFAGLFMSFPALYVASRIVNEWQSEDDSDDESRADDERLERQS